MLRPRAYVIAVAQTTSAAEGFGDALDKVGDFAVAAVQAATFTRHRQPLTSANLVTAVCGTRTGRLAGQSRAPGIGYRGKMTNPARSFCAPRSRSCACSGESGYCSPCSGLRRGLLSSPLLRP